MSSHNYWTEHHRISRRAALRGAGVVGLGVGGAALIGCQSEEEARPTPAATPSSPTAPGATPATTPAVSTDEPKPGGAFYRVGTPPSQNFNPVTNWQEANFGSGVHVYDRLLASRMGTPGYALEAATSIEVVDDVTVVFQLKDGLVYQDRPPVNGRPVLTEDIVTMQQYAHDEPNAQDNSFQRHFLDHAEAPDDRTVVYRLQHPSAYLFSGTQLGHAVSQCIAPSELVLGDFNNTEPLGSGPYQVKSAQFQVRYEYTRNPTYREADRGLPYIDERVFLPIANDPAAAEAAFRSGQSMVYTPADSEMADRLITDLGDQLEILEFTALSMNWRNMSRARSTFDDIRIREAFYRWYEPEPYIELAANGWGVDPPGQISAGLADWQLDWSQTEQYKRHDLQEARRLLDAAGFDFNKTYELTTTTAGLNQVIIQIFEAEIRKVGITNTTFKVLPFPDWAPTISNTGNYDFCCVAYAALDTPATPLRLNHTQPNNVNAWVGIRDPEIDALIEESERLTDREAQIAKVKEVQLELLKKYAHMGMVYTPRVRELRWAYVRDWDTTTSQAFPAHINYQIQAWLDL